MERMLSPPSGVFCNKLDVTKEFPTVVDRFTVAIDHFNLQTKVLDYVHVNYDSKEKLISFIYTQVTGD